HLQECIGGFGIAPLYFEATELLFGDITLFLALHDPANEPAELVDVHAGTINLRVEPGNGDRIGTAGGPASPRPALVLGLIDYFSLVQPRAQHLLVAVMHATGVALMAAMVKPIAQTGGRPLVHVHAFWDHIGGVVFNGQ